MTVTTSPNGVITTPMSSMALKRGAQGKEKVLHLMRKKQIQGVRTDG